MYRATNVGSTKISGEREICELKDIERQQIDVANATAVQGYKEVLHEEKKIWVRVNVHIGSLWCRGVETSEGMEKIERKEWSGLVQQPPNKTTHFLQLPRSSHGRPDSVSIVCLAGFQIVPNPRGVITTARGDPVWITPRLPVFSVLKV